MQPSFTSTIEPHPDSIVNLDEELPPLTPIPPTRQNATRAPSTPVKSEPPTSVAPEPIPYPAPEPIPCPAPEPSLDGLYCTIGAGILLGLVVAYAFSKQTNEQ